MNKDLLAVLDHYERDKGINRNTLVETIKSAILTAAKKKLNEEEEDLREVPTQNLAALDAYHRGRVMFAARTDAEDRASVQHFERAVELDPNFALAWVGLLRARTWLIRTGLESDTIPARQSLDRALA